MIRIRSGLLAASLLLVLGLEAAPAGAGRSGSQAGVQPTARVLERGSDAAFGAGACPTGIELELWPPNHKVVAIDLEEVLGPDVLDVEILSITQDEPVDERGDGHTECDGSGVGTSVAHLRAERSGLGNGRVYEIEYSAFAGGCSGFVIVGVPHDQRGAPPEDDGQLYDSGTGCP